MTQQTATKRSASDSQLENSGADRKRMRKTTNESNIQLNRKLWTYCSQNNLEEVKTCLSLGADVNAEFEFRQNEYMSCLPLAVLKNYSELVEILQAGVGWWGKCSNEL